MKMKVAEETRRFLLKNVDKKIILSVESMRALFLEVKRFGRIEDLPRDLKLGIFHDVQQMFPSDVKHLFIERCQAYWVMAQMLNEESPGEGGTF